MIASGKPLNAVNINGLIYRLNLETNAGVILQITDAVIIAKYPITT